MLDLAAEHHWWVFLLSQEQQITSHFQHAVPHPKNRPPYIGTKPRTTAMGPGGKVDYRVSKTLLWRFREPTFSRTYSTVKIAQTRIVEPIHPLLNKKMLTSLGGTALCDWGFRIVVPPTGLGTALKSLSSDIWCKIN
jgi:hypothetical protein